MISETKTITTTASLIVAAAESWRTIYLHVVGNGIVYLGAAGVTSTTGMPTEKSAVPFQFIVPANETVYAIAGSGTEDLRVLRPSAS